jgi:uncharacterized protein YodC (DUF2158 family)
MIVRSKFSPGQHVTITDAEVQARITGIMITQRGVTAICRWWDGTAIQENEFEETELHSTEPSDQVVVLCNSKETGRN